MTIADCCFGGVRALVTPAPRSNALQQVDIDDLRAQIQAAVQLQLRELESSLGEEMQSVRSRLDKAVQLEEGSRSEPELAQVETEDAHGVAVAAPRVVSRRRRDEAALRRRNTVAIDGTDTRSCVIGRVKIARRPPDDAEEDEDDDDTAPNLVSATPSWVASALGTPRSSRPSTPRETPLHHDWMRSRSNSLASMKADASKMVNLLDRRPSDGEDDDEDEVPQRCESRSSAASSGRWRVDQLDVGDKLASKSAARKGLASVDGIVTLIEEERARWADEKEALGARLEELKAASDLPVAPRDPEKEELKRQLQDLRKEMKARSRFGAWVCARHAQESDDEDAVEERAEREELRRQLDELEVALREARAEKPNKASAASGTKVAARSALNRGLRRCGMEHAHCHFRGRDSIFRIQNDGEGRRVSFQERSLSFEEVMMSRQDSVDEKESVCSR